MKAEKLHGLYLVADPAVKQNILLEKIQQALEGGVGILQLWNHWPEDMRHSQKKKLIDAVVKTAKAFDVPVLINDEWELLADTSLHGVHFDTVPENVQTIRERIGREVLVGVTCSNDLEMVKRADRQGVDYISFCAMFPSPSAGSCEIVHPDTVRRARKYTSLPLFVSGGITPDNLRELDDLDIDGVAVISGILNADEPGKTAAKYHQVLERTIKQ